MLTLMCSLSLLACSNTKPRTPTGVLLACNACSVTIQACPASVMLLIAASRKITCASSVLGGISACCGRCVCVELIKKKKNEKMQPTVKSPMSYLAYKRYTRDCAVFMSIKCSVKLSNFGSNSTIISTVARTSMSS